MPARPGETREVNAAGGEVWGYLQPSDAIDLLMLAISVGGASASRPRLVQETETPENQTKNEGGNTVFGFPPHSRHRALKTLAIFCDKSLKCVFFMLIK